MRYTYNLLKDDVAALNKELEERGHEYRFQLGHRNGYTAIDLARTQEHKRGTCVRNIQCGSPRECLAACEDYMTFQVSLDTLAE